MCVCGGGGEAGDVVNKYIVGFDREQGSANKCIFGFDSEKNQANKYILGFDRE